MLQPSVPASWAGPTSLSLVTGMNLGAPVGRTWLAEYRGSKRVPRGMTRLPLAKRPNRRIFSVSHSHPFEASTTTPPLTLQPWPYLVAFLPLCLLPIGALCSAPWAVLVLIWVIVPILDEIVGLDDMNPDQSLEPLLRKDDRYSWILRVWVLAQFCATLFCLQVATKGPLATNVVSFVLLAGSLGTVAGLGINVAHELTHRSSALDRALARVLLALVGYEHWATEHVKGHHIRVATPADPASAPRGMNAWRFVLRSTFGSLRSAWLLERDCLNRRGFAAWDLRYNSVVHGFLRTALLFVAGSLTVEAPARPLALAFLVGQAVVGVVLLELVNYIEHYGLSRAAIPGAGGGFEAVSEQHSWNAGHRVTNYVLFKLQRHSDHHLHPSKPFQTLHSLACAPQLPTGYAGMILLAALAPPLFFHVMDPRAAAVAAAHSAQPAPQQDET